MPVEEIEYNNFADFWNKEHRKHSESALSGHSLTEHLLRLNVQVRPTDDVLCIGVGMGDWIRDMGARKWALDISQVALDSVQEVVMGCVRMPEMLPKEQFDFAMSLWVAPHMTDRDLEQQICQVVRSLKPTGIFAMQYCEAHGEATGDDYDIAIAGGIERARETVMKMVDNAGSVATVAYVLPRLQYSLNEITLHIKRK